MSNQELINAGNRTMDETDQAIERSKQVSHNLFFFSLQYIVLIFSDWFWTFRSFIKPLKWEPKQQLPWKAKWASFIFYIQLLVHLWIFLGLIVVFSILNSQTEQMGRIVNELDTIQFSIKKASQLVKEIGRQVCSGQRILVVYFPILVYVI